MWKSGAALCWVLMMTMLDLALAGGTLGDPLSEFEFPFGIVLSLGSPFGVRPVLGNDSRLRAALAKAVDGNHVLKILVLGGSEASGEQCYEAPGDYFATHNDTYCWWHTPKTGHSFCSWAARLARYIHAEILPAGNFIVINGARGGAGSQFFVDVGANLLRKETSCVSPNTSVRRSYGKPVAEDADLVLLDFTANDAQQGQCDEGTEESCFPCRWLRALCGMFDEDSPTIAIVDVALVALYNGHHTARESVEAFRTAHRSLARELDVAVVDTVVNNGGTFFDQAKQRETNAFVAE